MHEQAPCDIMKEGRKMAYLSLLLVRCVQVLSLFCIQYTPWTQSLVMCLQEDTVLMTAMDFVQGNYCNRSHIHDTILCPINCSTLLTNQKSAVFHNVQVFTSSTGQPVFDLLNTCNRNVNVMAKSVQLLLAQEKWETSIIFMSSCEGFSVIPREELSVEATSMAEAVIKGTCHAIMPLQVRQITALSSSIQTLTSKFVFFAMDEEMNLTYALARIYFQLSQEDLNFIVACSGKCVRKILHQARQFEILTGKTSKLLIIPTDGSSVDNLMSGMKFPMGDIVYMEIIICKQEDTLFHLVHNSSLVAADVYTIHTTQSNRTIRHVGHISHDRDESIADHLFPGWKYGLNNQLLTVSTLEWPPFVYKWKENGSVHYSGVSIELLQELSRALNFSYRIVEPEDQEWGRVLDGKWTGLIGQLAYKVDLVAAPIAQIQEREDVMDFTIPYFYERSAIIVKKQGVRSSKWKTLVAPFRSEVHICIFFSLIFSAVFLFAVEEVHPVNTRKDKTLPARRKRIGDILWYHFGSLMANGGAYLPTTQSGRSVLACWWLFTVISAAIYSGNLVAFLTDWREKPLFSTLAEMVEQDTYKWGISGGSLYITLFQDSSHPVNRKIWQGLRSGPDFTSLDLEVHKRKLLAGKYAYLGEMSFMEHLRSEHCDLQIINDQFFPMNYGVGLHNKSVYTVLFSKQILRIYELGLLDLWYKHWIPHFPCETNIAAKRVDLLALQSVFYAVGVGVLFAFLVLMAEVMYNKKCRELIITNTDDSQGQ